ncbi:MAG: DUF2798 domain-containing protein [Microbacteriaceae bacterium]|nr:MAG: DUF2798 domain-containing protein [Microbacteriaceae bacterium]
MRTGAPHHPIVALAVPETDRTLNKTVFLTQLIMTFIMATVMSGVMSLFATGPSLEWLARWPLQIAIAWPIAFALTMVAWPASMAIANRVVGRPERKSSAEA